VSGRAKNRTKHVSGHPKYRNDHPPTKQHCGDAGDGDEQEDGEYNFGHCSFRLARELARGPTATKVPGYTRLSNRCGS
jgi:hypothetical protein